jgi:membrane protein DedA with SNARE-associated domain
MFGALMVLAGVLVIATAMFAVRYALIVAVVTLAVGSVVAYIFGTRGGQPSPASNRAMPKPQ